MAALLIALLPTYHQVIDPIVRMSPFTMHECLCHADPDPGLCVFWGTWNSDEARAFVHPDGLGLACAGREYETLQASLPGMPLEFGEEPAPHSGASGGRYDKHSPNLSRGVIKLADGAAAYGLAARLGDQEDAVPRADLLGRELGMALVEVRIQLF
jgi:hypothetical protein